MVEGLTSVVFERGDFNLIVNNVLARTCPSCKDACLDEIVAERLLEIARQRQEAGKLDTQCDYRTL